MIFSELNIAGALPFDSAVVDLEAPLAVHATEPACFLSDRFSVSPVFLHTARSFKGSLVRLSRLLAEVHILRPAVLGGIFFARRLLCVVVLVCCKQRLVPQLLHFVHDAGDRACRFVDADVVVQIHVLERGLDLLRGLADPVRDPLGERHVLPCQLLDGLAVQQHRLAGVRDHLVRCLVIGEVRLQRKLPLHHAVELLRALLKDLRDDKVFQLLVLLRCIVLQMVRQLVRQRGSAKRLARQRAGVDVHHHRAALDVAAALVCLAVVHDKVDVHRVSQRLRHGKEFLLRRGKSLHVHALDGAAAERAALCVDGSLLPGKRAGFQRLLACSFELCRTLRRRCLARIVALPPQLQSEFKLSVRQILQKRVFPRLFQADICLRAENILGIVPRLCVGVHVLPGIIEPQHRLSVLALRCCLHELLVALAHAFQLVELHGLFLAVLLNRHVLTLRADDLYLFAAQRDGPAISRRNSERIVNPPRVDVVFRFLLGQSQALQRVTLPLLLLFQAFLPSEHVKRRVCLCFYRRAADLLQGLPISDRLAEAHTVFSGFHKEL